MSLKAPVSLRTSPSAWQPAVLLVGNPRVAEDLSRLVREVGSRLNAAVEPLAKEDVRQLIFGRDHGIQLLDGSYLVPYSPRLPPWQLEQRFRAMLPLSSAHFLSSVRKGFGNGFTAEANASTLQCARENGSACTQGRTVIEGGWLTASKNLRNS